MMMKSRLLLYLDVNQTITVVDTAAGKTLSDGINCAIARAAWVRHMSDGPLAEHTVPPFTDFRWHDGSPVLRDNQDGATTVPPPLVKYGGPDRAHTVEPFSFLDAAPPGCLCYYDVFGKELSKRFTLEGPGVLYRALHDKLLEMLEWPDGVPYTDELVTDHNGKKYHIVVPSLFNLLIHLQAQDRDFKIILSTMGHNIRTPAAVFELFAQHKHPVFTEAAKGLNFDHLRCLDNVHWSLHVNSGGPSRPSKYLLQGRSEQEKMESEEAIYSFMTADTHACGVQSSFQRWEGQGFLAAAGKRLWFTADDHAVHPILFDDNIKKSEDSVVAVRARKAVGEAFVSLTPEECVPMHDAVLIQADIIQAILNPNYFIDSVAKCQANMARMSMGGLDPHLRSALAREPSGFQASGPEPPAS